MGERKSSSRRPTAKLTRAPRRATKPKSTQKSRKTKFALAPSTKITPDAPTPRMYSISSRPMGWRYAMIASVSIAGPESRDGRGTLSKRSRYGANSGRVRIWYPSARLTIWNALFGRLNGESGH